jgi:hypothetical protein
MTAWARIAKYPDYAVSSDGRVMRVTTEANTRPGLILKPSCCGKSRYPAVLLYRDGKRKLCTLHRLVAEAFIPNPENKPQVNHRDGRKTNNKYLNLEWATASENRKHAFAAGLQIPNTGAARAARARKAMESVRFGEPTTFLSIPKRDE